MGYIRHREIEEVLEKVNSCIRELLRETHAKAKDGIHGARFEKTYCSQCGGEFGPGDHGYSHCTDHN